MSPLEFVATPAASPMWMSAGSFSRSAVESNCSSGMESCAESTAADIASALATSTHGRNFVMGPLSRDRRLRWIQHDLLRPPRRNLGHEQLIRITAVEAMDGAEFSQPLARFAELAEDRAVELHLVDLTRDCPR